MIVDLFAGCGGADLGMRALGLDPIGFELNPHACSTRTAAGLRTVRADLSTYPPRGPVEGLWASPPCQDFSAAGKRLGRTGDRGRLVDIPPLWVDVLRPRWVVCEEVPPVMEIWEEHAFFYRKLGYRTWCGVVNCADLGLPQTRNRAILMASLDVQPGPPVKTHDENPGYALFDQLEPWVSMADALGWGLTERPGVTFAGGNGGGPDLAAGSGGRQILRDAREDGRWMVKTRGDSGRGRDMFKGSRASRTITAKSDSWTISTGDAFGGDKYERPLTEPAPTVDRKACSGAWMIGPEGHRERWIHRRPGDRTPHAEGVQKVTLADALILQGFPVDFPLQGSSNAKFLQVGNAVPPVLAERCVAQVLT